VAECLALGTRFAGSNLAKDNDFLRGIKIDSMPSFGGKVKLSVSCMFLQHVKECCEYERDTCSVNFNGDFFAKFLLLCYMMSLLVIARELWWMNQEQ
jgi:hypothetical protein